MIDKDTIAKVKAEAGCDVYLLEACDEQVLVRQPTGPEFERFAAAASDDARKSKAAKMLFRDCVLHPDADELAEMLTRKPGLAITFGGECAELAGLTRSVERKKV
jgi:hypothetical protein